MGDQRTKTKDGLAGDPADGSAESPADGSADNPAESHADGSPPDEGTPKEFEFDRDDIDTKIDYAELRKRHEEELEEATEGAGASEEGTAETKGPAPADRTGTVLKRSPRDLADLDRTVVAPAPPGGDGEAPGAGASEAAPAGEASGDAPDGEPAGDGEAIAGDSGDTAGDDGDTGDDGGEGEPLDHAGETRRIRLSEVLPELMESSEEAEAELLGAPPDGTPGGTPGGAPAQGDAAKAGDREPETPGKTGKRRTIRPIPAVAILAILYFVLFDEEEGRRLPDTPTRTAIVSPMKNEYLDEARAKRHLLEGLEYYRKGSYLAKTVAADHFRRSLGHQFEDNPAFGLLILTYAELLPNATDVPKATIVLHRLVRLIGNRHLTDINVAMGKALHFLHSGKPFTAVKAVEDYMRVSKKPTRKLFSVHLRALTTAGDFEKAKGVLERLDKERGDAPLEAFLAMIEFHEKNQDHGAAAAVLSDGLRSFPKSVALLLKTAERAFRDADLKAYQGTLERIKELGFEASPEFHSKYLEHMGVLTAMRGDAKGATELFRRALRGHENTELRSKIAALELGGDEATKRLILRSKVLDSMERARKARKERRWDDAFRHAIDAVDMDGRHIPSNLLLSDMQIERGYFQAAVDTLKKLKLSHMNNVPVGMKLVDAYIESHRFQDALVEINLFSSSAEATESPEYASALGRYFEAKGHLRLATNWHKNSIARDPMNDEGYFRLASIYARGNRFKAAARYLTDAIALNPEEARYKILYSRVLKDRGGYDAATGYLWKELENAKDKTQILGELAINYHKQGKIKDFEEVQERVRSMGAKDGSFYEFMMRTSLLNGATDKMIEYGGELLKIKPGSLETRIALAEAHLGRKELDRALAHLRAVERSMANYPKVNYHLAQVLLLRGDADAAMEAARKEAALNPRTPDGHFMRGEVLSRAGEAAKAAQSYERALMIDHEHVDSLVRLAAIRKAQNKFETARELLLRALKLDPSRPEVHKELGYVYKGIGQSTLASEYLETYLNLAPGAADSAEIKRAMDVLP